MIRKSPTARFVRPVAKTVNKAVSAGKVKHPILQAEAHLPSVPRF